MAECRPRHPPRTAPGRPAPPRPRLAPGRPTPGRRSGSSGPVTAPPEGPPAAPMGRRGGGGRSGSAERGPGARKGEGAEGPGMARGLPWRAGGRETPAGSGPVPLALQPSPEPSRGAGGGWKSPRPGQAGAVAGTGSLPALAALPPVSPARLFSNVWLWRAVAAVLAAAVILVLCVQFVDRSSAKGFPVCPSLELCPSGWLYVQRKCYYLSESEASWNSSQMFCSTHNASLLMIENHQELSFMVKITKQDPWIGLYKRNEEFIWVNGKALDNKLIEVKGSGNCAYLESKGVSASGCYLTRKWVCSLNINVAQ
ncbi:uncharacterized protein O3Q21_009574 [Podargus strigoides]